MAKCCLSCSLFTDFRKESYFHLTSKNSRLCCCALEPWLCCELHKIEAAPHRLYRITYRWDSFSMHTHICHVNCSELQMFQVKANFYVLIIFEFLLLRALIKSTSHTTLEKSGTEGAGVNRVFSLCRVVFPLPPYD